MLGSRDYLKSKQSLVPAARTATANGASTDLAGAERCYVLISAGVMTDGTHVFKLQESSDNSTFTDVAAGDVEGDATKGTSPSFGAADDNVIAELGYIGKLRYVRVVVTCSGTTTGGVYEAVIVKSKRRKLP